MYRHIKYTEAERKLANMARKKARNRDVLYHGTRYANSILKTGVLFRADVGEPKVFLTRSAEVAAYWATIERDDDEGRGSILIFDRQSLECKYLVKANPEVYWHSDALFHDEAEEKISTDVIDVDDYLVGVVHGPTTRRSHKHKMQNHELNTRTQARLLALKIGGWAPRVPQAYGAAGRHRAPFGGKNIDGRGQRLWDRRRGPRPVA